ncbi:unnamed protein product [Alopecurus aequalis]
MDARKRPAAVLDAAHATATPGSATCSKRRRTIVGSTDDYKKIRCIGAGSYGVVHEARHLVTGKTVAIKYFESPDGDAEEGAEVTELLGEARFLDTCSGNPYVVGFEGLVRDAFDYGLCLLMEYVPGPSLDYFFGGKEQLSESTVRAFMWKLLTGAKMMHDRHVVHRDIRPANILVGQDGELIKICNFGEAIFTSEPPPYTQAGQLVYMAPEMLLQKPDYDTQVDIWSLGCVMGEMLSVNTVFLCEDGYEDEDETLHLWNIFRVLGTPDENTWPGFTSLPFTDTVMEELPARYEHSRLREMFPEEKLSEQGFEVLQGLLTCNPDKRLTAAKALKHPWFDAHRPSAAAANVDASVELPREKALPEKLSQI